MKRNFIQSLLKLTLIFCLGFLFSPTAIIAQSLIPFSPTVSVSLSNTDCDSLTDLTINVSQDPNEPDMFTSSFVSDGGSFAISSMNVGDTVGSAIMSAGGGVNTFNTALIVSSIPSSTQAIIQSIDLATGVILGDFTISNTALGVLIFAQTVPDNNNYTSGNTQSATFFNVFVNPQATTLTFTSTIDSELGDVDVQTFLNTIFCGIPFSPTVSVSLSNTDCDSLTDLTINVSQDPNEPDMFTSSFVSDGGSFAISSMNVGDTVGSSIMSAGGGVNTFNTALIVSSIPSSTQAIIQSIDLATGVILGDFTISNTALGVLIFAQTVPDNNNYTSGNTQSATFFNVFVNPQATTLTFTSTIDSELGDVDVQTFLNTIFCGIPFSPTVSVSLSNTDCDSLTDLTINVSQDPNEPDMFTSSFVSDGGSFAISSMNVGDTVGSAIMSAGGGVNTFNTALIVSSIPSSTQAIIQSIDLATGVILGDFTISNTALGVLIFAQTVPDNNNYTSGNTQSATFFNVFVNPQATTLTFTSTIDSELGDVDVQTFLNTIFCGIPFSPTVSVSLSNTDCDSLTDLTINVSQDPNEPDMFTSSFVSDGGSFAISSMNVGDTVGSAIMSAGGGVNTFNTALIVSSIPSSTQAIIQSIDLATGVILGDFTISNTALGVLIFAQTVPDNNNYTSGNTQSATFFNVFVNPQATTLTFTSTIDSELGDVDVQTFLNTIFCGIPFSPTVSVSLSNTDCDSLTDLTINVSQDPNEPDMFTSSFVSDGGSFAISSMNVGDTVGSAIMSAGGGVNTFNTALIVSSIPSSTQAIIQSIDLATGVILGDFTISNTALGVLIFAQTVPDNNNYTSGNTQSATFFNVFVNPQATTLTFTSTIDSELGDVDVQTFLNTIFCGIPFSPTVSVSLSNTDCDSLTDLTINVSQDPNEPDMFTSSFVSDGGSFAISSMNVGDTVGSAIMSAGGGVNTFNTALIVSSIPSSTQAIIQSIDLATGVILGDFTISNTALGVLIFAQTVPDNNNYTSGNTQSATFFNVFVNPQATTLTFTSTIDSELGDVDVQTFLNTIFCGIPFSPTVSVSLSNTDCDSLTDLTINVSQDPNEPDMFTSSFVSDGGSFAISSMNVGDTVGSAIMSAGGGVNTFNTALIVSSIPSSTQAIIQSIDLATGVILGDFTISNTALGVLIFAQTVPDNNNYTSGNTQSATFFNVFVNPQATTLTFTSTIDSELGDVDVQTFLNTIFCGIPFSPTVSVSLSNTDCDSLTDLTINVSQDPNEPDMFTSSFVSDGGSFAISSMNVGDTVGSAIMSAGGGVNTFNTALIVSSIPSSTQAIIQSIDLATGVILGDFTISNTALGVLIFAQTVPDNNNYTSGNTQSATFFNVFVNPQATTLTFTSTIDSELGDVDVQTFLNTIFCGIPFSPTVSVSLSNTDCDSLTDLTINVSQDPNEPDMFTSSFVSDGGSFAISSMNVGDTVGSSIMSAGGGVNTFNTALIVSSIPSSTQAIIQSIDLATGVILGDFTISNTALGVLIFAQTVPDNNNYTSGNTQSATFFNVFVNPQATTLTFTSTIDSELGDVDVQTFLNTIFCGIPFSPTVSVSLSNTDCDSLTDLTINVSQDPNEPDMFTSSFVSDGGSFAISSMNVGDTVGSAIMSAGGGVNTFNTALIVSSIPSSTQAIIQSIDLATGVILGDFTISNTALGVLIFAQTVPDNNNYTSGNTQSATFFNVFVNPQATTLTFTSTIDSELGDVDVQSTSFNILCLCAPSLSTASITSCDTYSWNGTVYTTSGTYTYVTTNAAGCDSTATLNLTIDNSSTSTASITSCDTYSWNGTVYTTSGTYTYVTTNAAGCDSTATLNLTIDNSSTSTASITSCDTYSWNGTVYTTSGTYTYVTTNAAGCDSTATLNLTIDNSSTSTASITSCDTYSWNGTVYTTSGTYTYVTTNAAGCDSTATLNLTIDNSSTSTASITSCDTYSWNGTVYTTSGTYTYVTTNAAGCDSTATLNLTIDNSSTSTASITSCDTYSWNGTVYTTSGTYTYVTTNAAGCDSTATLNLTIDNSSTSTASITSCDTYSWNGTVYTTSGTYTYVTTNAAGCDSTATLNLTIDNSSTSTASITSCDTYSWNGTVYTTSGTYTYVTTNAAGCDSTATLNLTIDNSSTSTASITSCDTYSWNGTVYTTSGTYTYVTTNAAGCDSTATLNLTIDNSSTSTASITSCDTYSWNGTVYTTSGTYTYVTTNAAGCDSTATLNLTIDNSSTSTASITSCDTYSWNGTVYTTSGTYTYVTTNAAGCDSTATLNLTIDNSSTSTASITSCDTYSWNGTVYTTSGTYTYVTTNAAGCDSTATLNLTIDNSSTSTASITSCDTYSWNGTVYTTSGTYTYVTTNAAGCDSTATLNLTIDNSSTSTASITSCDTYSWNGTVYTTSGTYTYVTTNAAGCDSTATLNLTIDNSSTSTASITSCDTYSWNGTVYTTSGTYTYVTTNAAGCDSTATLNLTIDNSSTSTASITSCDTYSWNGTVYTTSGTYTYVTTNAAGCDSTATLNLTIDNSSTSTLQLLLVILILGMEQFTLHQGHIHT